MKEEEVARGRILRAATVGVANHGNSAVLVTVAPGGKLLDRRRIDLTDRSLPTHPHHHEGSWAVGRYVFSTPFRAADYVRTLLEPSGSVDYLSSSPRELVTLLRDLRELGIEKFALDRCPRCNFFCDPQRIGHHGR
jgi:hypothetical protein